VSKRLRVDTAARFRVFSGFVSFFNRRAVPSRVTTGDTHRLRGRSHRPESAAEVAYKRLDKTSEVVSRQIAAMGSKTFEVGLFKPDASDAAAGPVMIPEPGMRIVCSDPYLG
jgi:hypothetical protein